MARRRSTRRPAKLPRAPLGGMICIVRLVENMYLLVHCPFGKFDLGHAFKALLLSKQNSLQHRIPGFVLYGKIC